MEVIFEVILELFGEVLLQVLFEALASVGIHWFKGTKAKAKVKNGTKAEPAATSPWLAAIGYAIFGAIAGGISLWIIPVSFIHTKMLRIAYLALAPLLVGALFAAIGRWRNQRGHHLLLIDRFACGWLFALSFAAVRFVFTH